MIFVLIGCGRFRIENFVKTFTSNQHNTKIFFPCLPFQISVIFKFDANIYNVRNMSLIILWLNG
jgi:hypothetical protein